LEALDVVLSQLEPMQSAVVVSHLQVTRSIVSDALGLPTAEMTKLPVATASITCIDYEQPAQLGAEDGQTRYATVHFQSFKPQVGLAQAKDGAN
jgi:broad specificity phosphatase PhoE